MMIADSDYSSDEEIFAEFLSWERRPYTIRARADHFTLLDDVDFFRRFRLPRETVLQILALIERDIETPTDRNHSIAPIVQLLLTLRFYALGTMLKSVADFTGVSESAASIIVRRVSLAVARLAPQYIRMPSTPEEIRREQLKFYNRGRLPRIIGAIDCTHVRIQSPGGPHAENFRNRKGYFSLNVQTVSSEDLKIMDIVARWPGSVHDQTIFNKSTLRRRLEQEGFGNGLIVADSGYANSRKVVTLFLNPSTQAEELYNEAVVRSRNPVERSYGIWKRRFPVLSLGMRVKVETVQAIIIATAVLHNKAINNNCGMPPPDPELGDIPVDEYWRCEPEEPFDDNARPGNAREELLAHFLQRVQSQ